MKLRIAILDDYQGQALALADWSGLDTIASMTFFTAPAPSQAALIERLRDFEVVVAMRERTRFPRAVIEALPKLRLLVSTGLRNNAIDLQACEEHGVTTCGARGARSGLGGTAEIAWTHVLALRKHLLASHAATLNSHWQPRLAKSLMGSTLGLIGLGQIGQHMARIAKVFGMEVIAWSPNLTTERAQTAGVEAVSKQALLERSDVVSLHLVLAPTTVGILGAAELAQMKPSAVLVNTARAELVQEQALLHALQTGQIAGAGMDVFWQEPLPNTHPLLQLHNVVLTPHLGYATDDNMAAFYQNAVNNIQAWAAGEILPPLAR
jgi:phosphoglycerate dehydrogenase-like enzyme